MPMLMYPVGLDVTVLVLNLHLHPYFVYVSNSSGEPAYAVYYVHSKDFPRADLGPNNGSFPIQK